MVSAIGLSAERVLIMLRGRLRNEPETELRVAVEEQARVTVLRLRML